MKWIKDYLHLYLGCEILVDGETPGTLVGVRHTYDVELYVNNQWLHHRFCKLILRPLSDMTEEEAKEFLKLDGITRGFIAVRKDGIQHNHTTWEFNPHGVGMPANPHQFAFLLSKGFDLFNLHEQGLCLYKSDLQCEKK